ncbi:MAG: pseudouridine synthase [Xanthobacteraceae bacterium]
MAEKKSHTAGGERVAKMIARAGLASRREAEAWIAAGRVTINGEPVASPARNATAADRIAVDGRALPVRERTRLFLYHKPRAMVTSHTDPAGRPTLFAALPKQLPRLISVGRLDINTEGLLLLTNDGGLARLLELPATGWLRRYRVRAHGRVREDELARLREGITIDGVRYGAIEAVMDRQQASNIWLTLGLREGKNREIKNVLGHLGLAVNRLIRVSFGPFQLGDLPEGAIEEVTTRTLRAQLGERLAALARADFSGPKIERADQETPRPFPRPPKEARRASSEGPPARDIRARRLADDPRADRKGRRGPRQSAGDASGRPHGRHAQTRAATGFRHAADAGRTVRQDGGARRGKVGRNAERIGEPERARREKRRGRRPRGQKR